MIENESTFAAISCSPTFLPRMTGTPDPEEPAPLIMSRKLKPGEKYRTNEMIIAPVKTAKVFLPCLAKKLFNLVMNILGMTFLN
jgi:hypothetical protein